MFSLVDKMHSDSSAYDTRGPVHVSCIYISTLTNTVTRGPMLTHVHTGGAICGLTGQPALLRAHLVTLHAGVCGGRCDSQACTHTVRWTAAACTPRKRIKLVAGFDRPTRRLLTTAG